MCPNRNTLVMHKPGRGTRLRGGRENGAVWEQEAPPLCPSFPLSHTMVTRKGHTQSQKQRGGPPSSQFVRRGNTQTSGRVGMGTGMPLVACKRAVQTGGRTQTHAPPPGFLRRGSTRTGGMWKGSGAFPVCAPSGQARAKPGGGTTLPPLCAQGNTQPGTRVEPRPPSPWLECRGDVQTGGHVGTEAVPCRPCMRKGGKRTGARTHPWRRCPPPSLLCAQRGHTNGRVQKQEGRMRGCTE